MCQLLNMEDVVDEIVQHLGIVRDADRQGQAHISFEDFVRCRMELGTVSEIEHDRLALDRDVTHHGGMHPAGVDSVPDVPLQTPDNSDISQRENFSCLLY